MPPLRNPRHLLPAPPLPKHQHKPGPRVQPQDEWIRAVIDQHIAGLRYKHGGALAAAETAFNQAALEMDANRRLKLEALCSRARAAYCTTGSTAY